MKLFIRNIFLFGISCFFIAIIILFVESLILNNQGHFKLSKKEKYIILGHSHAQMALNDSLIDSSRNLASAGEAYIYTYIKLNKLLESNPGNKVIFVEYSNNNIVKEINKWIWDDSYIYDRYRLYSPYTHFEEFKLLFSKNPKATSLCTVRSIVNNIYYIFNLKKNSVDSRIGGYIYLERDKVDSLLRASALNPKYYPPDSIISNTNIKYLEKIILLCKKWRVLLYLIRNPLHPKYEGLGNEVNYQKFLKANFGSVELLDFKDFPLSNSDFGDLEHLNHRGARKYSLFVNKLIKEGLLEKENKQKFIQDQMDSIKCQN